MKVTNAAATVARNTEIDTKASALGLGLDSIVLLKRQGKSSIRNILSRSGDSLPKLRVERRRLLKKSIELGNPFVMKGLASNDSIRDFYVTSRS